jgi:hypothetical protein
VWEQARAFIQRTVTEYGRVDVWNLDVISREQTIDPI